MKNHYDTLGIPPNASSEDIKRAYYILAHQYHPDKNNGNEKRFKEIVEAYRILYDEQKRKEYNEKFTSEYYNEDNGEKTNYATNKTKEEKPKYKTIIFIIIIVIILIYNSGNPSDEYVVDEVPVIDSTINQGIYLTLGGPPTIHDDFSLKFEWYTAGEVLEQKEVSVTNNYSYKEPRTNGMFAIAVVSIKNNGKERRMISLSDFSLLDIQERIYKPYFMLADATTYDNEGKIISVVKNFDDITLLIQPGIEEKRAIIFEIAKDIESASLKLKYK